MNPIELEIAPNEKYRAVIHGDVDGDVADEDEYRAAHPAPDVADEYIEMIDAAPTAEVFGKDPADLDVLTWADISPARDPDLLSTIATYFDGIDPAEPADRIRAKCRLLGVETYTNAQLAAKSEHSVASQ